MKICLPITVADLAKLVKDKLEEKDIYVVIKTIQINGASIDCGDVAYLFDKALKEETELFSININI